MYRIDDLSSLKGLFHCFSTVDDGNMSLIINKKKASEKDVVNNRIKFFRKIDSDHNKAMTLWLEHSSNVVEAKDKWKGSTFLNKIDPPKADAVITNKKNFYLCLTIADCVPVVVYDPVNNAIGLVHAGWKGTDLQIIVKTVHKMVNVYGTKPKNLIIGIGPSVRKESYIKKDPDQKNVRAWKEFIEQVSENEFAIDVVGYNKKQLMDVGVLEKNIIDCGIDTAVDPRFYSHSNIREDQKSGRFLVTAGII